MPWHFILVIDVCTRSPYQTKKNQQDEMNKKKYLIQSSRQFVDEKKDLFEFRAYDNLCFLSFSLVFSHSLTCSLPIDILAIISLSWFGPSSYSLVLSAINFIWMCTCTMCQTIITRCSRHTNVTHNVSLSKCKESAHIRREENARSIHAVIVSE